MIAQWLPRLLTLVLLFDAKAPPSTEPLRFAGERPVDVKHIALELKVDVPAKGVEGTATIDLVALREVSSVRFDAVDFAVNGITLTRDSIVPKPALPG